MFASSPVNFSIVTPTRNAGANLRRCCASVARQAGPAFEHIVADGDSSDGTVEWLRRMAPEGEIRGRRSEVGGRGAEGGGQRAEGGDRKSEGDAPNRPSAPLSDLGPPTSDLRSPAPTFRWLSEPDQGMYDALNRGFDLAGGEVWAWLNADEQYLPGTLAFVAEWFAGHPDKDILFGDALLVRPGGGILARRRSMPVRWPYVLASHLYGLSCAMFFRRTLWDSGIRFDPVFRSAGDADWIVRALRAGFRSGTASQPLAAFTIRRDNLSLQPVSREEERRLLAYAPAWVRAGRGALNAARRAEMIFRGVCRRTVRLEGSLLLGDDPPLPRPFEAHDVGWRWPAAGAVRPTPRGKDWNGGVCYPQWKVAAAGWIEAALWPLVAMAPRPRDLDKVRRILIVEPFRLGDAALLRGMPGPLHARFPGVEIHLLLHPSSLELYATDSAVARVHTFAFPWVNAPGRRQGWGATLRFLRSLRAFGFDIGIDPRGDVRSHAVLALAGCAERVGYTNYLASNIRIRGTLLTRNAGDLALQHRTEVHAVLLALLGCPRPPDGPAVAGPRLPGPLRVVVSTGAGWSFRLWPEDRWAAVVRWLAARTDVRVRMVGPAAERERLDWIRRSARADVPIVVTDLPALMRELAEADLVVCPDSLVMHLASEWFGLPVAALFGPGSIPLYHPRSPGSRVLDRQAEYPCAPCTQQRCVQSDRPCMHALAVADVLGVLETMLGDRRRNDRA